MNVHIKLYGVFRSAAQTSQIDLETRDQNPTVKSVLLQLVSETSFAALRQLLVDNDTADPRPNALIIVSGREINTLSGLETTLTDGDELSLLPVAHGG